MGAKFGSSFQRSSPPNLHTLRQVSASANCLASPPTVGLHQPTWGSTNMMWQSPGSVRLTPHAALLDRRAREMDGSWRRQLNPQASDLYCTGNMG